MIFLQGELWTATAAGRSDGEPPVPVGAQVEVVEVHGLRLVVNPLMVAIEEPPPAPDTFRSDSVIPVPGGVREVRQS
jgi:hypothetical protein